MISLSNKLDFCQKIFLSDDIRISPVFEMRPYVNTFACPTTIDFLVKRQVTGNQS